MVVHKTFYKWPYCPTQVQLSSLVLDSENLNRALRGRRISHDEYMAISEDAAGDSRELYEVARVLRRRHKGGHVTFSKKAFFNLINLCRDTCSYCTFKSEPGDAKASLMSRTAVSELLHLARKYHCVEALFVTGQSPEEKYGTAREWLAKNGFSSTAEFLIHASEEALDMGLFPHTNAGNLSISEIRELAGTNPSIGLMLESTSERLHGKGMPHHAAPSKLPEERIRVLEDAGRVGIPTTTGLLLGMGETRRETVQSMLRIRDIHERYGHIQEIILQNFEPKYDTMMGDAPPAERNYFMQMVAMARIIMPDSNIQIPPNLSPETYQEFLNIGINDWGGISPLTIDHVNPEFAWPDIRDVEENTRAAGYDLCCRFPVYPEFIDMTNQRIQEKMRAVSDESGLVREDYWR